MSELAEVVSETLSASAYPREEALAKLDYAIERAQRSLIEKQDAEGYWHAPLEANAEMNAEFIIFNHFMDTVDVEQEAKLKKLLLDQQNADGSWSLFPEGPGHLSTSIEVYFALKLAGMRAGDEPMMQARRWILSQGGIENCGTLARFYLAAMDQVPWDATASVPVEVALLPNWFPFNMYELSSWARGTTFALMILQATRPVVKVSHQEGVLELYIQPPHFTRFKQPPPKRALSLRTVFNLIDKVLRVYDHHNLKGLRARALAYAENWIVEHQDANGSWGGIQPCYLLSAMALKALGYRNHHPVLKKAIDASRELVWDLGDALLYMPCVSPNWDTALAAKALIDSGIPGDHPALRGAARWLVEHQIFRRGDWSIKRPSLDPGGWAFQFYNDWYPDVDDSAVILMVIAEAACEDSARRERAITCGATWVMGMQSKDGGFAAFDVDNDSHWLNSLPLADVEAVTDPSCADLTGRILEMMAAVGYQQDHPVARRSIEWLRRNQQADGAWWGRWGVAYVYGTFSALSGLHAIGYDMKQPWIQRAVDWLKSKQNPDGGWGESPLADRDPSWRGRGTSTASQTAWGIIGLLAGEDGAGEQVLRGVQWLVERQNENGAWEENEFTGTGFPGHFYLRYWLYSHYFPLMALGRFRARMKETVSK
jgi:squalene-hopene/tetraprenyl-beta-curcumene cyclase